MVGEVHQSAPEGVNTIVAFGRLSCRTYRNQIPQMSLAITSGFERMRIQQILLLPLVLTVSVLAQDKRLPPHAERLAAQNDLFVER